jgi:hypothetical protein
MKPYLDILGQRFQINLNIMNSVLEDTYRYRHYAIEYANKLAESSR